MKYVKNDKGITLMLLIITVVVMLIIAGVSIYSVVGQGQAMDKAKQEQSIQKFLTFKQAVEMDLAEILNVIGDANISPTDDRVINRFNYRGYTTTKNTDGTLSVKKDGMEAKINANLEVGVVGYDI